MKASEIDFDRSTHVCGGFNSPRDLLYLNTTQDTMQDTIQYPVFSVKMKVAYISRPEIMTGWSMNVFSTICLLQRVFDMIENESAGCNVTVTVK